MTPSRSDLSVSRLELLVLARLASPKSPSDKQLAKVISDLAMRDGDAHPDQIAANTLAQLRRRGLAHESRRTLTDNGAKALRAGFDLDKTPLWKDSHKTHLLTCALGLEPGSKAAIKGTKDVHNIASIVVRNHYKVAKPSDLADKMIAAKLGLPAGPVTLARIRAHMLAQEAGVTAHLASKQIIVKLAAKAVDKPCHDKRTLAKAMICRWIYEPQGGAQVATSPRTTSIQSVLELPTSPPPTNGRPAVQAIKPPIGTPAAAKPPRGADATISADTLLDVVREAIPRVGADGRVGAEKVFVSALWRRIEHDTRLPNLSFDRFKSWLVTANRDQLIDLARADVRSNIDPKLVAESEIEDFGATFHFVVDRRVNGARGVHAR